MSDRILNTCNITGKSYEEERDKKEKIWETLLTRSEWVKEMGAFLITSPSVSFEDKLRLNIYVDHLATMREEYEEDKGWAYYDTALITIASRFTGVNMIACKYPLEVKKYKAIKAQAHARTPSPAEPRTTFRNRWQGHYRYQLLRIVKERFPHERTW